MKTRMTSGRLSRNFSFPRPFFSILAIPIPHLLLLHLLLLSPPNSKAAEIDLVNEEPPGHQIVIPPPDNRANLPNGFQAPKQELFVFRITDRQTGKPHPKVRYRTSDAFGKPNTGWRLLPPNGELSMRNPFGSQDRSIEFDAEGYRSYFFEFFAKDPGVHPIRLTKAWLVPIMVLNPDASPATNTQVIVSITRRHGSFNRGTLRNKKLEPLRGLWGADSDGPLSGHMRLITDANGAAEWTMDAPQFDDHMSRFDEQEGIDADEIQGMALNDHGFASFLWDRKTAGEPIQLFAWSNLKGDLSEGDRSLTNHAVILVMKPNSKHSFTQGLQWLAMTDSKGHFQFKDVPAGDHLLFPSFPKSKSNPSITGWAAGTPTQLLLHPGKTTAVHLRESGPRIRGSAVLPAGVASENDFSLTLEVADYDSESSHTAPTHFLGEGDNIQFTAYGGAPQRCRLKYKLGDQFEFVDVPPGKYVLHMTAIIEPGKMHGGPGFRFEPPPRYTTQITVPDNASSRNDVQLGVLELNKANGFPAFPQHVGPQAIP